MLAIGTVVFSTYNPLVTGKVIGYGFISHDFKWWDGDEPKETVEPAYLVALNDRIDCTKLPQLCTVSVMVLREQHTKEV